MEWDWVKEQLKQGNKVRRIGWTPGTYYTMKDDIIWTYISINNIVMQDYVASITMEELDADDWILKYTGYKSNEEQMTLNKKQREQIAFIMNECSVRSKEELSMENGCKDCCYNELCKSILRDINQVNNGNVPKELRDKL